MPPLPAVFIGATLTATSVGITARVLSDLGRLQERAARVVLGAAVVDDVLGLVLLAVVSGLAETGTVAAARTGLILAKAITFLVVAIGLGIRYSPVLLAWVGQMKVRGSLIVYAIFFCVLLAAAAERSGLAAIIGAFAAGLILAKTERRATSRSRSSRSPTSSSRSSSSRSACRSSPPCSTRSRGRAPGSR